MVEAGVMNPQYDGKCDDTSIFLLERCRGRLASM
jgi:hypothetical protein